MRISFSFFFLLSLFISISSCIRRSDALALDVKEVDYLNKSDMILVGNQLDWNIEGSYEMAIMDSLLMFVGTDVQGMLKVFSLNSQKQVGNFCLKGRAKNEFIEAASLTEQTYTDHGNIYYPIVNFPNNELKVINISESIKKHATVVTSVTECTSLGEFVLLDNDASKTFECRLVQNPVELKKREVPASYWVCNEDKQKRVRVFNRKMRIDDEHDIYIPYTGQLSKHPDRNLVVEVHSGIDYIFFFDFDAKKNFAIHQQGTISFNDLLTHKSVEPHMFSDVAVAKDYFFVLYWNGDYSNGFERKERKPELFVFDWDGNFLSGAKLDQRVMSIEYDENNKTLYGINRTTESLYKFDVKPLISNN